MVEAWNHLVERGACACAIACACASRADVCAALASVETSLGAMRGMVGCGIGAGLGVQEEVWRGTCVARGVGREVCRGACVEWGDGEEVWRGRRVAWSVDEEA